MKKLALVFAVVALTLIGFMAGAQGTATQTKPSDKENSSGPKAEWNTLVVDLGDIKYMTKADAEFLLKNTGDQPLIITTARASCGCTNLRYSQEPILPGQTAPVQVTFNGSGRGNVKKTITIQTNASTSTTILAFTANVIVEGKTAATTPTTIEKKQ